MKDAEYYNMLAERMKAKRERQRQRLIRDIEDGVVRGKIIKRKLLTKEVTIVKKWEPKGIQNYYSTRELVKRVNKIMDQTERNCGERFCYINGKWQLQIRGKHLRRLKKHMPGLKQVGRKLVQE